MRRSSLFMLIMACGFVAMTALLWHGGADAGRHPAADAARQAALELAITDPCLFTEARYTRHLALADRHAPLQEHPLSLEHFPSGALILPPPTLSAGIDPRQPREEPAEP
jgi:hypothetical protein